MNKFEIIGLIASVLIVFSMVFKTTTFKGTILMRVLNLLGSIFFIIYGFMLPAYATAITNCCVFALNVFYIAKETIDRRKVNESSGIK